MITFWKLVFYSETVLVVLALEVYIKIKVGKNGVIFLYISFSYFSILSFIKVITHITKYMTIVVIFNKGEIRYLKLKHNSPRCEKHEAK